MLTVGVDLAAEATKTAVAWIDWSPGRATVRDVAVGVEDDQLVAAIQDADKAGIDCPFGWPRPFVGFVTAHQGGQVSVPPGLAGRDWRRELVFRTTDRHVRATTGLIPLSVSADRIGHAAMRCAGLLAELARCGAPVDRRGDGVVVEVYPAASLHRWGLPNRGYKGARSAAGLTRLADELAAAAPWLAFGRSERLCRHDDDAMDAVIAALTARAAALGRATRPSADQVDAATTEGWIAVPTCRLRELRPSG